MLMGLKLCVVRLLTAIILFLPSVIQASNVLVAGTEFSASQRKGVDYVGVGWVDQIGLLGGEFSVFVPLADNVDVDVPTGMSAFHNECHYAVTTNPMILDSAAYKSDTSGNGYMVVSPAKNSIAVFSYVVSGLKPNSLVTVKMGVANLINPLGIVEGMRVDASSLLNVTLTVNGVALRKTDLQAGKSGEMVADKGVADAKGEAVVTVMMSSSPSTVLGVDYLRVYADVEPLVIGKNVICSGGESSLLSTDRHYKNCSIQWYKLQQPVPGACFESCAVTSGDSPYSAEIYYYTLNMPTGDVVRSSNFVVNEVSCCVAADGYGLSGKLLWQDDFGTATSANSYWTWDYSDVNNPVKRYHNDGVNWQHSLETDPAGAKYHPILKGATCDDAKSFIDGRYTVACNVTDDLANTGTRFSWVAMFGNGRYPSDNGWKMVPDHTYRGADYGGMLYLNSGNRTGETIYSRTITGLCSKGVTVTCYLNNFSDSYNPIRVVIRIVDVESGNVAQSDTVTRYANGKNGSSWVPVSIPIVLTGDAMKFEIVSIGGDGYNGDETYNEYGNDLILDDIQVRMCTEPVGELYFDLQTHAKTIQTCAGEGVSLNVDVTPMIKHHFGDAARYIYQYSFTPAVSNSWVSLCEPTAETTFDVADFLQKNTFQDGKKVYFRSVLGTEYALAGETVFSNNDVCADYSISDTVSLTIMCPSCTAPLPMAISSSKKAIDNTVYLCEGEQTVLKTNDVVPGYRLWNDVDFDGFSFDVYLDGNLVSQNTGTWNASSAEPYVVKNEGVGVEEIHTVKVVARDNRYPTAAKCAEDATLKVIYMPLLDTLPDVSRDYYVEVPDLSEVAPSPVTMGGVVTIYADADLKNKLTHIGNTSKEKTYYYTETTASGCESRPAKLVVNLMKIPNFFTPNGDGENDIWEIPGIGEKYPDAVVKIYDRWGKLLAKYRGRESGWNGTYKGHTMPSADYWYSLNIEELDKIYTGHFTLLR